MAQKTVELGMEVKDRVTGYKGIVTSIAKYLSGCDRCLVQPPVDKENKLSEPEHFDITDLVVVSDGLYIPPVPIKEAKPRTGGPRQFPSRT